MSLKVNWGIFGNVILVKMVNFDLKGMWIFLILVEKGGICYIFFCVIYLGKKRIGIVG